MDTIGTEQKNITHIAVIYVTLVALGRHLMAQKCRSSRRLDHHTLLLAVIAPGDTVRLDHASLSTGPDLEDVVVLLMVQLPWKLYSSGSMKDVWVLCCVWMEVPDIFSEHV
jgi:hypothetical protein